MMAGMRITVFRVMMQHRLVDVYQHSCEMLGQAVA
jgi:hypothetical protein